MNATSIEPARPASEHLVSLSHHSYLIRSVSGSDELALFDMFARSSPEDLRLRCLGMIKDFPRLAAARLARCDRDREIALVAVDGEGAAPGEIVGVAHLIEEPAEPSCAEFDILVRTDVKGHGRRIPADSDRSPDRGPRNSPRCRGGRGRPGSTRWP